MNTVSTKTVAEAIYHLLRKTKDPAILAQKVASYLVVEHQTRNTDRILREVERLRFVRDSELEVTASSARKLNNEVKSTISGLFKAKKITLLEKVDPVLLGGVTIQAMDRWLDLSARNKLKQLKNSDQLNRV